MPRKNLYQLSRSFLARAQRRGPLYQRLLPVAGSYSNFQVGLEEGDKDIETMRGGLPERSLWLAGEHTAPFMGLGTATGAYWSGESVGRRIADAYGRSKKDLLVEIGQSS